MLSSLIVFLSPNKIVYTFVTESDETEKTKREIQKKKKIEFMFSDVFPNSIHCCLLVLACSWITQMHCLYSLITAFLSPK